MTPRAIAEVLRATGGCITQDAIRAHSGNYQAIVNYLDSLGLTERVRYGQRTPRRVLRVPLDEALRIVESQPEQQVVQDKRRKSKANYGHHKPSIRTWRLRYDPPAQLRGGLPVLQPRPLPGQGVSRMAGAGYDLRGPR